MRKIYKYLLIIILFLTFNVNASTNTEKRSKENLMIRDNIRVTEYNLPLILKTPKVNEQEKVYDFANLLTSEEEEKLYNDIINYIDVSNYDLAVVTISDNNKKDEIEYSDDFYDYNNFGFDTSHSGSLLLIDMDNRVVYISTKGYAIKMYDDYRIDTIIDAGYTYLKNGKYYGCITRMISKMSSYYNIGFPSSNDDMKVDGDQILYDLHNASIFIKIVTASVVGVIVSIITSLIMYFKTRLKIKAGNAESYLTNERDLQFNHQFINSTVTRVPRNNGSSGSSGGGFGGSSIHVGSSGSSHGGGGRGF